MNRNFTTGAFVVVALAIGFVAARFWPSAHILNSPPGDGGCTAIMDNGLAGYSVKFSNTISAEVSFDWGGTPGFHHNIALNNNGSPTWYEVMSEPCTTSGSVSTFNLHPPTPDGLQPGATKDTWAWSSLDTSPPSYTVTVTSGAASGLPKNTTGRATRDEPQS